MNLDEWNGGTGTQKLWLNPAVHTITADTATVTTGNVTTVNASTLNTVNLNATSAQITNLGSAEATLVRSKVNERFGSRAKFVPCGNNVPITPDQFCGGVFVFTGTGVVAAFTLPSDASIDAYLADFPAAQNGCVWFDIINRDNAVPKPVYLNDGTTLVLTVPVALSSTSPSQVRLYFSQTAPGQPWVCWNTRTI